MKPCAKSPAFSISMSATKTSFMTALTGDCRATELRIERIAGTAVLYSELGDQLSPTEAHLLEMLVFLLRVTNGDGDKVHF